MKPRPVVSGEGMWYDGAVLDDVQVTVVLSAEPTLPSIVYVVFCRDEGGGDSRDREDDADDERWNSATSDCFADAIFRRSPCAGAAGGAGGSGAGDGATDEGERGGARAEGERGGARAEEVTSGDIVVRFSEPSPRVWLCTTQKVRGWLVAGGYLVSLFRL